MSLEYWQSDRIYLQLEEEILPVEPGKGYTLSLTDYEHTDTTEAGTSVREVTRLDIPHISVGFECDLEMLKTIRTYKKMPGVTVKYFDPLSTDELKSGVMYVTNYREVMLADTLEGGIWSVSFELEDLCDV